MQAERSPGGTQIDPEQLFNMLLQVNDAARTSQN